MDTLPCSDECYYETLQKIGRNVVFFGKIEVLMKYLVGQNELSGPASEILALRDKKKQALSRKTLGQMKGEYIQSFHADSEEKEMPADLSELWIEISSKWGTDEEIRKERKRTLAIVVKECNRLIHHMVAHLNPNRMESCTSLIVELDAQFEKILPEFERLQAHVKAFRDAQALIRGLWNLEGFPEAVEEMMQNAPEDQEGRTVD